MCDFYFVFDVHITLNSLLRKFLRIVYVLCNTSRGRGEYLPDLKTILPRIEGPMMSAFIHDGLTDPRSWHLVDNTMSVSQIPRNYTWHRPVRKWEGWVAIVTRSLTVEFFDWMTFLSLTHRQDVSVTVQNYVLMVINKIENRDDIGFGIENKSRSHKICVATGSPIWNRLSRQAASGGPLHEG